MVEVFFVKCRLYQQNGDYGRNEHQGIIMQAILEKVQQNAATGDKAGVLAALSTA